MTLVKCEVFTAVTDIRKLFNTHENVLRNLERYIEVEENRLNVLKRYLKLFTDEHEKMSSDGHKYVDHPINSFTLIKRLSTDFERLKTVASEPTEFVWDREMQYATEEDLTGAAVAISRLQFVYKLNTTHLAEGNLQGVIGSPMTASDCYNLALMLYKQEHPDYNLHAAEWFEVALEKLNIEQYENTFTATEVMTYIIKSYHRSDICLDSKAYEWAERLFVLKPNASTDFVMKLYEYAVKQNKTDVNSTDIDLRSRYSALCCGETNVLAANTSKLHCSYLRNIPFLKLAPIKMEEVHKDPNVFIFYDVLSDDEFQNIKTIAGPKLERAKVVGGTYSDSRIGKSAWLDDDVDVVAKLRRRTADFTGLSMSHAERLQVLNYGIGGHFDWHYDAFNSNHNNIGGNRIATVLFYMTDVTQGGATVFAHLNLTVTPKKGSALFWENLQLSGEKDNKTLHAACPVLYGSKWVSNIWIHEAGQELSRPCPAV
ncbi:prolyl 4-hydroxylase subunit alpha-2-like isoform X2 [Hyposmocoma kahamanoa]|uniref:prolyl 4-hydroxylase subunit alpha-2-like isoform X2 n=1 Tax=Hyposmocoma kahamanoa TaxID=1477025 RepID=UPI000E6DA13A|nr:prolyl 4-hydroxylase subunit alpha-2-like isoform X2 [Hyposmocoma kahamanoa]